MIVPGQYRVVDVTSELMDLDHCINGACISIEMLGTIRSEYHSREFTQHVANLGVFMANKILKNDIVDGEPSLLAVRNGVIPNKDITFLPRRLSRLTLYQFRDNPIAPFC